MGAFRPRPRPPGLALLLAFALALPALLPSRTGAEGKKKEGALSGTVRYAGERPRPQPIEGVSEPACADKRLLDETVIVSEGGGLSGVLVRLAPGSAGEHAPPSWPVIIRQKDCAYRPRVAGIVAGQELFIENNDRFLHNVHARLGGQTWFNRSQPRGAPAIVQKDAGKPGEILTLGCDVHPWMKAHVAVSDNPFFTVTKEDGSFTLEKLPRQKRYTLEVWHPELGKKTLEVRPGKPIEISFP